MPRTRSRLPDAAAAESRAATDALLAGLAAGGWRPRAWCTFLTAACRRSREQALAHPRAGGELAALHAGYLLVGDRRAAVRVATTGALALTHLGMLKSGASLGVANTITLTRANFPYSQHADPAGSEPSRSAATYSTVGWPGVSAPSPLSRAYADSLADAAFWIWFAGGERRSVPLRVGSLAAWGLPVAAVSTVGLRRGRMVDPPRSRVLRSAAALQLVLALRALLTPDPVPR